jgi:hypothetical protein
MCRWENLWPWGHEYLFLEEEIKNFLSLIKNEGEGEGGGGGEGEGEGEEEEEEESPTNQKGISLFKWN